MHRSVWCSDTKEAPAPPALLCSVAPRLPAGLSLTCSCTPSEGRSVPAAPANLLTPLHLPCRMKDATRTDERRGARPCRARLGERSSASKCTGQLETTLCLGAPDTPRCCHCLFRGHPQRGASQGLAAGTRTRAGQGPSPEPVSRDWQHPLCLAVFQGPSPLHLKYFSDY